MVELPGSPRFCYLCGPGQEKAILVLGSLPPVQEKAYLAAQGHKEAGMLISSVTLYGYIDHIRLLMLLEFSPFFAHEAARWGCRISSQCHEDRCSCNPLQIQAAATALQSRWYEERERMPTASHAEP